MIKRGLWAMPSLQNQTVVHWGMTAYWDTIVYCLLEHDAYWDALCTGVWLCTWTPSALGHGYIQNAYVHWGTGLLLIRTVLEPVASIEEQAEKRREENKPKKVTYPSLHLHGCSVGGIYVHS